MKVTIYGGGGGVGSSTAFGLLSSTGDDEVVLVDCREEMTTSHVMDLEQVLEIGGSGRIRSGDAGDVLDADVVVVAAAAPLTVNTSRLVYLLDNARIVAGIAGLLGGVSRAWPGVLLVVTNPVDPLCTWLRAATGIDRRRVVGYTLNDSLRLRTGLGAVLGVGPGRVEAWSLGEHGDGAVPLLDRVLVDGEPVAMTPAQRESGDRFMRTWYERHVALDSGRSSTWTTGTGVAGMVRALRDGSDDLWPASVVLEGEYGVEGAALTVPVRLGPGGAEGIEEWELSPAESEAFVRAASAVKEQTDRIDVELRAPEPSRRGVPSVETVARPGEAP